MPGSVKRFRDETHHQFWTFTLPTTATHNLKFKTTFSEKFSEIFTPAHYNEIYIGVTGYWTGPLAPWSLHTYTNNGNFYLHISSGQWYRLVDHPFPTRYYLFIIHLYIPSQFTFPVYYIYIEIPVISAWVREYAPWRTPCLSWIKILVTSLEIYISHWWDWLLSLCFQQTIYKWWQAHRNAIAPRPTIRSCHLVNLMV